jgi:BirA family transcriptional regulator, biotin operon repressor / biotin---[acetyl-CoA-carboxylase] ligase
VRAKPTFGFPRRHYRLIDSTNERARRLAGAGAPGGTVVTADEQTAGRGRHGRSWSAPAGKALLASVIMRALGERHGLLPLAVPIAVCEAAERLASVRCKIKWPNDVWIEGRKCAGILIEAKPQEGWAVIGVGMNLTIERNEFPPELRGTATSLGAASTPSAALAELCGRLGDWLDADPQAVLEAFRARDALWGREIRWSQGEGTADGVDEMGNLIVVTADGERLRLGAGEVHLRL